MSQRERILSYLKENKTITPLEALSELGVYRLSARIGELRTDGHDISTETLSSKNRYGEHIHFAKYVYRD